MSASASRLPKIRPAFPTPFSLLLLILLLTAAATWLLPAGRYDTLAYDTETQSFTAITTDGDHRMPATQATLDSLHIQIALEQFRSGAIKKPVSIPGTYHSVAPNRQGLFEFLMAPILGIQEAVDVILFVLVIGGFIAIFNRTGASAAGINALVHRLRGRESLLIVVLIGLMALGGSSYGLGEETIAFFPLLVPVFVAAGYDVMVPLAVIFVGSTVGVLASTGWARLQADCCAEPRRPTNRTSECNCRGPRPRASISGPSAVSSIRPWSG